MCELRRISPIRSSRRQSGEQTRDRTNISIASRCTRPGWVVHERALPLRGCAEIEMMCALGVFWQLGQLRPAAGTLMRQKSTSHQQHKEVKFNG